MKPVKKTILPPPELANKNRTQLIAIILELQKQLKAKR